MICSLILVPLTLNVEFRCWLSLELKWLKPYNLYPGVVLTHLYRLRRFSNPAAFHQKQTHQVRQQPRRCLRRQTRLPRPREWPKGWFPLPPLECEVTARG